MWRFNPITARLEQRGGSSAPPPTGGPNILWTDLARYRDSLVIKPTLNDSIVIRETIKIQQLALGSVLRTVDSLSVPAITVLTPDILKTVSVAQGNLADLIVGRSASPDTDIEVDCWVDGVPLNNGVNHGNETPLPVSGDTLLATEKSAYLYWNLKTPKFENIIAKPGGTMRISIWLQQGLAVAQTLTFTMSKFTTQPFVESTVNWNTKPALGTNVITRSISVLVGAVNGRYDIDLTEAEYSPYMGAYLLVYAHSAALLATPINIQSRESATSSERPRITFDFKR